MGATELRLELASGPVVIRPIQTVPMGCATVGGQECVLCRATIAEVSEMVERERARGMVGISVGVRPADFAEIFDEAGKLSALGASGLCECGHGSLMHNGGNRCCGTRSCPPQGQTIGPCPCERFEAALSVVAPHGYQTPAGRLAQAQGFVDQDPLDAKALAEAINRPLPADHPLLKADGVVYVPSDDKPQKIGGRDFGEALDKAMPASMEPRPGEQCKACGEPAPMTLPVYWSQRDKRANFAGWARFVFPWPGDDDGTAQLEWVNLCPPCGKRAAEYIAYCCQHPHPRNGR